MLKQCLFRWAFLIGAVLLPVHAIAAAPTPPPSWPWRGINMNSLDSTPSDIHRLTRLLGMNSVHLQMSPGQLGQRDHLSPDQAWARSLQWVNAMLAACKHEHVVGIVEVTGIPLKQAVRNAQTSMAFWSSDTEKQTYLGRISSLAKSLSGFGAEFGAYDIMSEPVVFEGGRGALPPSWDSFQPEIIRAIRKLDPDRWIMVKPGPFGSPKGYRSFSTLNFPRLIYSVHMYDPHVFTHQGIKNYPVGPSYPGRLGLTRWDRAALERDLAPVVMFQREHDVPVYVGEFSAVRWANGAEAYLKDLTFIFDEHGWGWAYFSFGGWNGWNPDYSSAYPATPKDAKGQWVGATSKRWATLKAILPKNEGGK